MAVILTGVGGLAVRLGSIFARAADAVALKGGAATARVLSGSNLQTWGQTIEGLASESPSVAAQLDGHWGEVASAQKAMDGFLGQIQKRAQSILIQQVWLDSGIPQKTLLASLVELKRQMVANSDFFEDSNPAIGAQTAVGVPTGNPVFVWSTKWNDGLAFQSMKPETIRVSITTSTQTGATARQEQATLIGGVAPTSVWDYDWHLRGSGSTKTLTLCDAQGSNTKGNKLYNSSFETATTANHPDQFTVVAGTVGTHILRVADPYTGTYALKIVGDAGAGDTATQLTQAFATAASTTANGGGTPATLTRATSYAFHGKAKRDNALSAGSLTISLIDGSGNVINDDAGTANTITLDLTTLTASYASFSGTFRTPSIMPTTVKLRILVATPHDAGDAFFLDDLALAEMVPFYQTGVSSMVAGFAGSINPVLGDSWTFAATNTAMSAFAQWLERFFGIRALGITMPYSTSATLADSLIL